VLTWSLGTAFIRGRAGRPGLPLGLGWITHQW
jgi:hypothetical protein